jgi:spore maturation protein CgeB
MKIFVVGSSITSAYWNGAATYYRGIYKNLSALGHSITFAEPDIYGRQQRRDAGDYSYVKLMVYRTPRDLEMVVGSAQDCDVIIKHSGVGADDEWLERELLHRRSPRTRVIFWDVDAPATLARVQANPADSFRPLIPQFDLVLTYGGGPPVIAQYRDLGARECFPIYNALDPDTHYPENPDPSLYSDMAFIAHRLPDRERRVEELFLRAARLAPEMSFILGGEGWQGKQLPGNVRWIGHVPTAAHNRINCSARVVLNINRDSMAGIGFSPPTRIFEAAGAGACVLTDQWPGIECFFQIGREIMTAGSAEEVVSVLRALSPDGAHAIGSAMWARALRDHTYAQRTRQVHAILQDFDASHAAARQQPWAEVAS